MKVIKLLLLLFLLAGAASAQSAASTTVNAPGVTAEAKGWREEVRNPALDYDPLTVNRDQLELERARRQNQEDNVVRAKLGLPQLPPPTRLPSSSDSTDPNSSKQTIQYTYTARVTNTGTKEIRKVVWEYVFFEPGTEKEVGRRHSENKVNIRPGQSKTLVARSGLPPTGTIDASQAGKKGRAQFSEKVVIQSIEYSDGTTWQRAQD
jgi:hypothetical protein